MENERVTKKRVYSSTTRAIAVVLCLLVARAEPSPLSDLAPVNAVELLTAFSGESATQYEPLFRFSRETRIVAVEIHAVGTHDTTARYSGLENAWHEVNNILLS